MVLPGSLFVCLLVLLLMCFLFNASTATSRLLISLLVGYVSIYSYKLIGLF